ncbi:MAG TPA: PaaI family thioesterase, partial [Acidimicrobiales bacterium]|nr:PaaI family thioesterase [Acidimicrobiales bacterium]
ATFAVLDPGDMHLDFPRPATMPMLPVDSDAPAPEEFFRIEPGIGSVTRLELADHLRNPWGILHGGAMAVLVDVASCRAVQSASVPPTDGASSAAADTVLHYLRPARVGPIEARCQVLGGPPGSHLVRVAVHDAGAGDRVVALASVVVLDV